MQEQTPSRLWKAWRELSRCPSSPHPPLLQPLPFFELSHQLLVGQGPAGFKTKLSPLPLLSLSIDVRRTSQPCSPVSQFCMTELFVSLHPTSVSSNSILWQTLSLPHLPPVCPYMATTAPASVSALEDILLREEAAVGCTTGGKGRIQCVLAAALIQ